MPIEPFVIFAAKYLGYILLAVFVILFLKKRNLEGATALRPHGAGRNFLLISLIAAVLSRFIFTGLIRFFYFRPRPFVEQAVAPLFEHAPTASFPSGHAAFYFALSLGVFYYNKKIGIWFFVATLLITSARVFAGVHYATDILGGLAVALLSFWLVKYLAKFARLKE